MVTDFNVTIHSRLPSSNVGAINAGNQGLRAFFTTTTEEMASPIGPRRRNLLAEDLEESWDSNGNLF